MRTDFDSKWRELGEEVMSGMKEWRIEHPRATLREIESALDERLAEMRARMLAHTAPASDTEGYSDRFTHGFVMTFVSRDDLDTYNRSEPHRRLVEGFRADVEDKLVVDFYSP